MLCQIIHKNSSNICGKCAKTAWNVTFWTNKKVKEKDSDLKISSPVGQIDCKNRKRRIKLLLKRFAKSSRKNPPICAGNVPKLPKMSLFEPREKSQKRMATSEFALLVGQTDQENVKNMDKLLSNWFGNWFRRKTPICAKNVPKRPKVLVLELEKKWN